MLITPTRSSVPNNVLQLPKPLQTCAAQASGTCWMPRPSCRYSESRRYGLPFLLYLDREHLLTKRRCSTRQGRQLAGRVASGCFDSGIAQAAYSRLARMVDEGWGAVRATAGQYSGWVTGTAAASRSLRARRRTFARIVAGSHTLGKVRQPEIHAVASRYEQHSITGAIGSALLMRPLLLHASSKSTAGRRRRVLHLEFAATALPDGLDWHRKISL